MDCCCQEPRQETELLDKEGLRFLASRLKFYLDEETEEIYQKIKQVENGKLSPNAIKYENGVLKLYYNDGTVVEINALGGGSGNVNLATKSDIDAMFAGRV